MLLQREKHTNDKTGKEIKRRKKEEKKERERMREREKIIILKHYS